MADQQQGPALGEAPDDSPGDVATSYPELVAVLARHRQGLGVNQVEMGERIGMPSGYLSQLECYSRTPTAQTVFLWLEALGLAVQVIPHPAEAPRAWASRARARYEDRKAAERARRARAEKGAGKRCRHDRECCPDPEAIQHFPGRAA